MTAESAPKPDWRKSQTAEPPTEEWLLGIHAVEESLKAARRTPQKLVFAGKDERGIAHWRRIADQAHIEFATVKPAFLDRLGSRTEHQQLGLLTSPYPYLDPDELPTALADGGLALALDSITDPRNLGAILRSALFCGLRTVILPMDQSAPVSPVAVRASAGAAEHLQVARVKNLARQLETLAESGWAILGADERGDSVLEGFVCPERAVLVLGAEGKGMRKMVRRACTTTLRMDARGPIPSLNVSVAAGVMLYALSRRM